MSTPASILFTNEDEIVKRFEHMPEQINEISKKAARAGGKAASAQMRKGIPKEFRKLCKYKVYKDIKGTLSVKVGLFNTGKISEGMKTFDWFVAYWNNYGTLARRDPTHRFERPVKRKNARGGLAPRRFVEAAAANWHLTFADAYSQEFAKGIQNLIKK